MFGIVKDVIRLLRIGIIRMMASVIYLQFYQVLKF